MLMRAEVSSMRNPNASAAPPGRKAAVRCDAGVVVSHSRAASEIGARVLEDGGNAVDAAVATALAVSVAEPWMSGIGGVGGMLIRRADTGEVHGIDFMGRAPQAADPRSYALAEGRDADLFGWPVVEGEANRIGAAAAIVPGDCAGLGLALETFGTLSWRRLLEPALALAARGMMVDWYTSVMLASAAPDLSRFPSSASIFLPGGRVPAPAAAATGPTPRHLANPRLVETLAQLADKGPQWFYTGELAATMVADIRDLGGLLEFDDFAAYRAQVVTPKRVSYRDAQVFLLPELNGGLTLGRALLALAERLDPARPGDAADVLAAYVESLAVAWEDRFSRMGDMSGGRDLGCTTHLNVVDRHGNQVALTHTLLSGFGARLVLPRSGVLLNNGMYWFDPRPGRANSVGPGKRPLCNICPALLEGRFGTLAIGGAGGRKIIPAVLQVISRLVDFGASLDDAIDAPRLDASGTPWLVADPRLGEAAIARLATYGDVIVADHAAYPINYAIVGATLAHGDDRIGKADPIHPWAEAVPAR